MLKINSPLVATDWLAEHLADEALIVLDASVPPVVPGYTSINNEEHFQAIPGARRFDYDGVVCKPNSSLPHMMPAAGLFEEEVRKLGVNNESVIVVYDDVGLYASPRAWWMFRAMGHEQVAVLNGGLPKWIDERRDVVASYAEVEKGNFNAREDDSLFCDFEVVLKSLYEPDCEILDARSAARFRGEAPEPRPGVRGGHMPNAKSLPFPEVLNDGQLKSAEELIDIFAGLAEKEQKVITSCGSGITACILTLAANVAGYEKLSVYDGSWAEWGAPSHLPVVTD
ncbi:MAG: sulfurtransferase [Gammaproteobacteria bacterium]|nr:sulfurtransferase [Gammaproteobacteria bacterium]